jgi:hypothetical protein
MYVKNVLLRDVPVVPIAIALMITVFVWSVALYAFVSSTQAASLRTLSDVLSNSNNSSLSNHTISFSTPTGISNGSTTAITFPAGFNLAALTAGDIDVASTTDLSVGSACGGATQISAATSSQTLTLTFCSAGGASMAASTTLTIEIGTNATFGQAGAQQITNPAGTASYEINIAGTMTDSGDLRVAILPNVVVTASVDTSLTFTVAGLATSTLVNGTTTTKASTATTLAFGVLPVGTSVTLGQALNVSTNAKNGFVVTVVEDQNLLSTTGADIDLFLNGSSTPTPIQWQGPSSIIDVETSYGHFGVTSNDDLNNDEFGTSTVNFAGNIATPRAIFTHTGPSDGTTVNIGSSTVAYRIQIGALQEAGDDYTNTLTYVATPTF